MRLRLETATRPPFWIIGDPLANARTEQSEAFNVGLQITRNTQAISGAGFETQLHFDRGNQKVSFDGTCHRLFDTALERLAFIATLAPIITAGQVHEWEGTAWLREDEGTGFLEYELPQCTLMLTGTQIDGAVGLKLTYRCQAGGFGDAREGTSLVKLIAGAMTGPPILYFFGTETGGSPTTPAPVSDSWPGGSETSSQWSVQISGHVTVAGTPAAYNETFTFVPGVVGTPPSYITPMASHLAAIASYLNATWFDTELVTVGGRSAIKITLIKPDDGSGDPPYIGFTASLPGPTVVYNINVEDSEEQAVLIDDNGILLVADSLDG